MPDWMDAVARLDELWLRTAEIWDDGGWAMWAIGSIAMVMFALGCHIHLNLKAKSLKGVPEHRWRRWLDHADERRGRIGEMIEFAMRCETVEAVSAYFERLRSTETMPFERDLKVMKICVSAAPLVGLLGTVTGMLSTFGALSAGGGGDKTMTMVAAGISEALITTETGLVIALPGLFFQYQLGRRFERFQARLAHIETVCSQKIHRRIREREEAKHEAARREVVERIQQAIS